MKILILSVEGDISNTEINFYNGLNYHVDNKVIAKPIGKCSDSSKRKKQIEWSIRQILKEETFNNDQDVVEVFFIGDKDKPQDIESMERSISVASNIINKIFPSYKINSQLICNENQNFEQSFLKIKGSKFKSHKVGTNVSLFKNFALSANWFTNNDLNKEKIINDLTETNNQHKIIFDKIFE